MEKHILPLYGLKCEHAARTFGTLLMFDFGKKSYYTSGRTGKKMATWEWTIMVGDCDWELLENGEVISSSKQTGEDIDGWIKMVEGRVIQEIKVARDFRRTEFFFEGIRLVTDHNPRNSNQDWSMRLRDGRYLLVGPKRKWWVVDGDSREEW